VCYKKEKYKKNKIKEDGTSNKKKVLSLFFFGRKYLPGMSG